MGDKTKAYLCVGGPYDGRRYASDRMGFQVAQRRPLSVVNYSKLAEEPAAPVAIESIVYVADRVKTTEDEIWFWRPVDQNFGETVKLLLDRYEKTSNIILSGNPWGDHG